MSHLRDPRLYQIASLSGLLAYGLAALGFDIGPAQVAVSLGVVLLAQYTCGRLAGVPRFDARSALISGLSLCLLLRTDSLALAAAGAFLAVSSKFVLRIRGKHVFNPTNFGLVVMILLTDRVLGLRGPVGDGAAFFAIPDGVPGRAGGASRLAQRRRLVFPGRVRGAPLRARVRPGRSPDHSAAPAGERRLAAVHLLHDLGSPHHARRPRRRASPSACWWPSARYYVQFRLFRTERPALVPLRPVAAGAGARPAAPRRALPLAGAPRGAAQQGAVDATHAGRSWPARCWPRCPLTRRRLLRLLRRQGRHQALQPGLAGRARARRRPHRHDHGQRLPGRAQGVRDGHPGAHVHRSASRSRSRTRRCSTTSTPTRRRASSSTTIDDPCRRMEYDALKSARPSRAGSAPGRRSPRAQPGRHHRGPVHGRGVRHPDPLGEGQRRARDLARRERLPHPGRRVRGAGQLHHASRCASSWRA